MRQYASTRLGAVPHSHLLSTVYDHHRVGWEAIEPAAASVHSAAHESIRFTSNPRAVDTAMANNINNNVENAVDDRKICTL